MEKNSTPKRRLLPWAANLATVAVVLAAMAWSGAQRPTADELSLALPGATQRTPAPSTVSVPVPSVKAGMWPVQGPAPSRDALQSVGYLPGTLR